MLRATASTSLEHLIVTTFCNSYMPAPGHLVSITMGEARCELLSPALHPMPSCDSECFAVLFECLSTENIM